MINSHPSWEIIDSSKLDDYLRCPRRYFYAHILGWSLDTPNHDLYFGEAWHLAREYQLIHGYEDVQGAYNTFLNYYRLQYPPSTDANFRPKTPEAVEVALNNFAFTYFNDLIDNELLRNGETNEPFTEISGTVPIDERRVLHFRMDSLLRNRESGKVFSWDHKTTSAKYITPSWGRDTWGDQFYLSIQNGTYTHCMYCIFPIEEVLGVEFCGVGFEYLAKGSAQRPSGYYSTLRRVPAFKTPEQMNVWLYTVNMICDNIEVDMGRLSHCKEGDNVLMAFPLNPSGCSKYKGCEFWDLCLHTENPLRICDDPPFGFKTEFWNPADKDSRNKMNLQWK